MLGKLIKHEFRHSARYHFAILIATVAVTAVVGLSLITDSTLLKVLASFGLMFTGIATIVITVVSIIKNFYDTMFTRLGYLTMTLPVKGSTLLLSKIIVAIVWVIVGFVAMAVPYSIMIVYAKHEADAIIDLVGNITAMLSEMLPSASAMASFIVVMLVLAFLYIIAYIGYIYFSVTIANTRLFQNHPKLYGALTFMGIFLLVTRIGSFLGGLIPFTFNVTQDKAFFAFSQIEDAMLSYPLADTIFAAIMGVALLAATGYIIENKINIK